MEEEINTGSYWSFIEENYPNYDSSDEICKSNDFSLWIEGEREDGDFTEDFVIEIHIQNELKVFEKALRNYIKIKRGYNSNLKDLIDELYEEYDTCGEIIDALRSLESNKEITKEEYDFILENYM